MENQTQSGATLLQQRLVRRVGLHYVAYLAGRSSIGTTEEAAIEGLAECLNPYWIAYCPECDWLDSSENAAGGEPTGGDDYTDAICPKCCADPNDPECSGKNVVIEEFSLPNVKVRDRSGSGTPPQNQPS